MKPHAKANGNLSPKSAKRLRDPERIVEAMAAKGLSADVIAACLGMDRNTLRGRHALSLHNGREKAKKQKVEARGGLTREEMHAADAILGATSSHWQTELGNLIFDGLDGSGAKTAADAYAAWLLKGGHWNCSGLTTDFSAERVAEFARLKAETEQLLKRLNNSDGR
jgi:hypothetical protein